MTETPPFHPPAHPLSLGRTLHALFLATVAAGVATLAVALAIVLALSIFDGADDADFLVSGSFVVAAASACVGCPVWLLLRRRGRPRLRHAVTLGALTPLLSLALVLASLVLPGLLPYLDIGFPMAIVALPITAIGGAVSGAVFGAVMEDYRPRTYNPLL